MRGALPKGAGGAGFERVPLACRITRTLRFPAAYGTRALTAGPQTPVSPCDAAPIAELRERTE